MLRKCCETSSAIKGLQFFLSVLFLHVKSTFSNALRSRLVQRAHTPPLSLFTFDTAFSHGQGWRPFMRLFLPFEGLPGLLGLRQSSMARVWVSSLTLCRSACSAGRSYGPNLGFKFKVFPGPLALRKGSMARIWVSSLRVSQVCLLCEQALLPESGFQVQGLPRSACSAKRLIWVSSLIKVFPGLLAWLKGSMARIWVTSLKFSQVCLL